MNLVIFSWVVLFSIVLFFLFLNMISVLGNFSPLTPVLEVSACDLNCTGSLSFLNTGASFLIGVCSASFCGPLSSCCGGRGGGIW